MGRGRGGDGGGDSNTFGRRHGVFLCSKCKCEFEVPAVLLSDPIAVSALPDL
jgi:hypothetical protein